MFGGSAHWSTPAYTQAASSAASSSSTTRPSGAGRLPTPHPAAAGPSPPAWAPTTDARLNAKKEEFEEHTQQYLNQEAAILNELKFRIVADLSSATRQLDVALDNYTNRALYRLGSPSTIGHSIEDSSACSIVRRHIVELSDTFRRSHNYLIQRTLVDLADPVNPNTGVNPFENPDILETLAREAEAPLANPNPYPPTPGYGSQQSETPAEPAEPPAKRPRTNAQ